jgi:hypothetical protein
MSSHGRDEFGLVPRSIHPIPVSPPVFPWPDFAGGDELRIDQGRGGTRPYQVRAARKLRVVGLVFSTCFLAMSSGLAAQRPIEAASAISRLGELPLYFEANQGQVDERVQFFARGLEHAVYLEPGGVAIALREDAPVRGAARLPQLRQTNSPVIRLVRMNLVGANANPRVEEQGKLSGKVNYLLGNEPAQWQRDVPTFARVQYHGVYPGVDLIYYGNQQELEYDFLVAPGADPSAIALRFEGADRLEIDSGGDLILHVGSNQLRQHKPVVYQTIAGVRQEVPGRYRLEDGQRVTFVIGQYDRSHGLVIDPVLSYSTFLGGSRGDIGWAIAVDASGSAYVAGDNVSYIRRVPKSGYDTNFSGGGDAFVARLDFDTDTSVLTLGYLTYLGGNGIDGAVGIAVDGSGAAYITGYTTSSNFPAILAPGAPRLVQTNISGAFNKLFQSYQTDAFVTKLNPDGSAAYSTYLGGELNETGTDIGVDAGGFAYVVGYTDSGWLHRTTNRVSTTICTNAVCGGTTVRTNTVLVRSLINEQTVTNIMFANVTIAGVLTSNAEIATVTFTELLSSTNLAVGFPVVGAVQTNNAGLGSITNADLFITKIAPDGSDLVYSTYLGGSGDDFGTGIAVDPAGNVVVSGYADSPDFPVTNAFQRFWGGGKDAVIAKLDASGANLIYSTFLGGTRNDVAYRLAVDEAGSAYVAGAAGSTNFPSTPGAYNRGGVFQSDDAAADWAASSSGLTHSTIQALLADPVSGGTLYAGTPRGVFKTTDGGVTWSSSSSTSLVSSVNALALDPAVPSTIYAGTSGGLFKSTDAGLSWTNSGAGLSSQSVRTIVFDAASSLFYAGTARGIFKSTDLAATNWVGIGLGSRVVNGIVVDPGNPAILYAATANGVYKSTNSGVTWRSSNKGLKALQSRAIAIHPSNPETLFLGTARGLYTSTNAATNWSIINLSVTNVFNLTNVVVLDVVPSVNALLIDPNTPTIVYAGTSFGLFKSPDTGLSWSLSQSNLTSTDVIALAFPSSTSSTIYAGTRGRAYGGGTNDAFLVKFAPDGLSLDYALSFGGARNDEAWDVAVDSDGGAYVVGQTASSGFPVINRNTNAPPYLTKYSKKIDAFVTHFDPTGGTNIFSILLGGKANDFGHAIALDPARNVYVVGRTESPRFPITNTLQTIQDRPLTFNGGKRDAFVAKIETESIEALNIGLQFVQAGDKVVVSWSALRRQSVLECCDTPGGSWMPVAQKATVANGRRSVVLPASAARCFFRLRRL